MARQQPGLACEECRRRKARCDRGRPQCGICADAGRECVFVDKRAPRGPKKGQLKDLRSRVGMSGFGLYPKKGHPLICKRPLQRKSNND